MSGVSTIETTISSLRDSAMERIAAAGEPEALEAVRVDVLGRKGALANISK
jgi:phenylalanyl-tRNA synthetase alpha chain